MANLSFTSSGATPQTDNSFLSGYQSGGNSFLSGYKPGGNSFLAGYSAKPAATALNNAQTPPPEASTPLKKTTTNNVDGSSVIHEYHAPDVNSGSNSQAYKDATTSAQTAAKTIGGSYTPETGYTPGILGGGSTSTPATSTGTSYGPSTGPNSDRLDVNGNLLSTGTPAPQATFPGIVNSLANTSQTGSQNATTATAGLLNSQSANDSLKQQAQDIGDKYGSQIMKTSNYGNALAGSYTNGAGLAPVSQGLAGQAQQTTAAEVAGQKAAEDAALAPIDRELTAQSQAQSGLASAGSTANTQQGNVQSGLTSAAGAYQPQLGSYGQTYYQPGQVNGTNGNNLDPQKQASSLAQDVINHRTTYDQAIAAMGYAGSAGTAFLNNAITSAGGNPLSLQAEGTTQQSVINTQGQQVAAYQSAHQQAQNLQSQLTDLIKTFGLNPNDLSVANLGIQKIAKETSGSQYQILANYLADVASRYAQILTPTGGSQTDTTRDTATGMLSGIANGKSIIDVMNALDQQAQAVIAGVQTTGGGNGATAGTYSSGSGSTYHLPY